MVPALATAWRRTGDTTWEFQLRPNVKFADGTPFTAEDVVAGMRFWTWDTEEVVALVAWPLYTRLRRSISQNRRERWAREERPWGYTEENDPDLRRDPADPPSP